MQGLPGERGEPGTPGEAGPMVRSSSVQQSCVYKIHENHRN